MEQNEVIKCNEIERSKGNRYATFGSRDLRSYGDLLLGTKGLSYCFFSFVGVIVEKDK